MYAVALGQESPGKLRCVGLPGARQRSGSGLKQGAGRDGRASRTERGATEGLTVVGHHGVPLVMLLSRSQMMLYALKLRGQRRQRGQRGHLHSRKRHFLLAGRKHFRFRLRAEQIPPTLLLLSGLSAGRDGCAEETNLAAALKAAITRVM